jgi:hypothetical protein
MGRDVEGSGGGPVRGLVWKVRVARRLDGESKMELLDYEVAVLPT